MKETLSSKIDHIDDVGLLIKDVREFIKKLKEITMIDFMDEESFDVKEYHKRIDNLAGEELTK